MKNPRVSVITPVYNAGLYLEQMLDSLICQSLKDIEIICVDDGSVDDSALILEEYSRKDKRIHVITQKNLGPGPARNAGIKQAKGEYILFLDADDFFERDMLSRSYRKAKRTDADIVVFRSNMYLQDQNRFAAARWTIRREFLPLKEPFAGCDVKENLFGAFVSWSWDKLFKREFVTDNALAFQSLRNDEDLIFVMPALALAKRISTVDSVLVHHRKTNDSLSATRNDDGWDCVYFALCAVKERLIEFGLYKRFERDFINNSLHCFLRVLNMVTGASYENFFAAMKRKWTEELEITGHDLTYFYREDEYVALTKLLALSPEDFIWWRLSEKERLISEYRNSLSWKAGRALTIPLRLSGIYKGI